MIFTPDDFAGDWYGWVTNQSGHALFVGVGGFMLAYAVTRRGIASYVAVLVCYAMWELRHYILAGDLLDSVVDWLFVSLGASLALALWQGRIGVSYVIGGLIAVASAIGIARRAGREDDGK